MASERWDPIHKELESQGKFDSFTTPYNYNHTIPVDEKYEYIPKSKRFKVSSCFYRTLLWFLGPLADKILFGAKVYGKEKLKGLEKQGYFTVMNHCSYLDSLMLRHAVHHKKVYLTVADFNNKSGYAGHVLRAGGILPLASTPSAARNMNKAFHELISKGHVIQFYAEQAMWMHYEKPRPFKKGAFTFAVREKAPIVPIYIRWSPTKGIRSKLGLKDTASIIILDPVYPKEDLPVKENVTYLQQTTQREFIEEYRRFYNIPKEQKPCIYDILPEYMDSLDEETKFAASL